MASGNENLGREERREQRRERRAKFNNGVGRPLAGLVLVVVGGIFLAREMGIEFPSWLFSWPMILIAIGIFVGAKHSFRGGGWIIPIFIGIAFLIQNEFLGYDARHIFWPLVIILIGVFMILRPRRKPYDNPFVSGTADASDVIDSSVMFGGIKKNIISKNFQGGRIDNFFGGTDLNLMQADFNGTIYIDFNVAFGGVKLIVPPQWNIKNEISCVLGGIEEKRPDELGYDANKVLILRGSVMFGGVEIKSR